MTIKSNFPSIRPSLNLDFANTRALDPRITFTRTTTATYYDGKTTAKAEENLFLHSQEFDNAAWSKANTTVTANNTAAPDGTTTAELVVGTGAADTLSRSVTVESGAVVTLSMFIKYSNMDWVRLTILNGANEIRAWFDVNNGTLGTVNTAGTGTSAAGSIQNIGNGWYRCILSGAIPATTSYTIVNATASADASFTRVTNGERYLWGAQLEQRDAVTA